MAQGHYELQERKNILFCQSVQNYWDLLNLSIINPLLQATIERSATVKVLSSHYLLAVLKYFRQYEYHINNQDQFSCLDSIVTALQ